MSWSARQRQLLDALGYEVLVPGRVGQAPAGAAADATPAANDGPRQRAGAGTGDKLLEALRRAAGGADPMPLVADLARLRTDPAGKRALWPRLRALRKGAG